MTDLESLAEWTAEAASHLSGTDQAAWLARIEGRYVGILLALERCAMGWSQQKELCLRIAVNLGRYWWMSGRASRGRGVLVDLLPGTGPPTTLRANGLLALAGLDYAQASYRESKSSSSQACEISRQLGNDAGVAASLNQLGMVLRETGDLAAARQYHEEALALFVTLGDERGAVSCRSNLGVVALFEGNLDAAEELHQAALTERRRLGDVRGIASSLGNLATITRLRGDPERAQEMHEEALAMRRELGDPWGVAGSLVNLCLVAVQRGDLEKAADLLSEATRGFTSVGDRLGVCETLHARALLTAAEDLPAEAVRLLAVAECARSDIGAPLPPIYRREADRLLAESKALLDKKVFDAAWQAGCSPRYSPFPLA
jgi:tetratricopeptide (TPR) repeat protein